HHCRRTVESRCRKQGTFGCPATTMPSFSIAAPAVPIPIRGMLMQISSVLNSRSLASGSSLTLVYQHTLRDLRGIIADPHPVTMDRTSLRPSLSSFGGRSASAIEGRHLLLRILAWEMSRRCGRRDIKTAFVG